MSWKVFCLSSMLVLAAASVSLARPWTDVKGRRFEGTFVRVSGDKVVISTNGRNVQVPLAQLSEADQKYVRDRLEASGEAKPSDTQPESPAPATPSPEPARPAASSEKPPTPGAPRTWTYLSDQTASGKFVDLAEGEVRIETSPKEYQAIRYVSLSLADQEFVRRQLVAALSPRVPPITAVNRDWILFDGETIPGVMEDFHKTRIEILTTGDVKRTVDFVELGPEDRRYVRDLARVLGTQAELPPEFEEPRFEHRTWLESATWKGVGGKFISRNDKYVTLRTATSPAEQFDLAKTPFSSDDLEYLGRLASGQVRTGPAVSSRQPHSFSYGPTGVEITGEGELDTVTDSAVRLKQTTGPPLVVAYACLAATDRQWVQQELARRSQAYLAPPEPAVPTLAELGRAPSVRDWQFTSGERCTGKLQYVAHRTITIEISKQQVATIDFNGLSVPDQEYVWKEVAGRGKKYFEPPPPKQPPPTPPPPQAKMEYQSYSESPLDFYTVSVSFGYFLGVLLLMMLAVKILTD